MVSRYSRFNVAQVLISLSECGPVALTEAKEVHKHRDGSVDVKRRKDFYC